jgi:HEAT repeat protein
MHNKTSAPVNATGRRRVGRLAATRSTEEVDRGAADEEATTSPPRPEAQEEEAEAPLTALAMALSFLGQTGAALRGLRYRHPDPSERGRRVRALPADETARQPLLEAVGDVSLDVARQALRLLVPIAGPAEVAALRERMLELDIGIVGDVAAALRTLGDKAATEVAIAGLAAESPFAKQKAAVALRELRNPAARAALLRALSDQASPARRVALEALARLPGEAETVSACQRRLVDPDASVRAAAVAALAALDPAAQLTLRRILADPHPAVRRAAAEAATTLGVDSVSVLLRDRAVEVRVAALEALSRHPRHELMRELIAAAADLSWHARHAAVDALGASSRREAAAPLVCALLDPQPLVRGRALLALERLLGDELDDFLSQALAGGARPELRRTIVQILGRRGHVGDLLWLAADDDSRVRLALLRILATQKSSPEVKSTIEQLAQDADIAVRNAAVLVLAAHAES